MLVLFAFISKPSLSFGLCFHWVLSEKKQWVLTNQTTEIRKEQQKLGPCFPCQSYIPGYYDSPFSTEIWTLSPTLWLQGQFPEWPSHCTLWPQHELSFPAARSYLSWHLFCGSPTLCLFFHALLFLVCHSPPLLIISILHGSTQTPLCYP